MDQIQLGQLFTNSQLEELLNVLKVNLKKYPTDDMQRRVLLRGWLRAHWDSFTTKIAEVSGHPEAKDGQDIDYWSYSL